MDNTKAIFLYGPPASGKSTLAHELSNSLNCNELDTDNMIAEKAGCAISEIFAKDGEERFRDLESEALLEAIERSRRKKCVVALGGGTLLRQSNREACERAGNVICLDAPSDAELRRRLGLAPGSRPLGDRSKERAEHYASFGSRLAASFILPDSLVLVGNCIAKVFIDSEKTVFDATVASLYPLLAEKNMGIVPSGEVFKTPATVMELWHSFAKAGVGRKDTIMACGGGVTGDLTGFAAATWMRGVQWFNFPTTLLSMVDASTGGKTGCDLPDGKNLAGAFHSPRIVVIDTDFLRTLPERELLSGRAEMLKHLVISGKPKCSLLHPTASMIADNLSVKVDIVREDPLETKGRRMLLNCGHTVGHAVETALNYTLSHGEAVAMGCVEEARVAVRLGQADVKWPDELAEVFAESGFKTEMPKGISFDSLKRLMRGDKKRVGNTVRFALPCGWGDVRVVPVDLS